jgi:flagellar basal body-associated protein FliL
MNNIAQTNRDLTGSRHPHPAVTLLGVVLLMYAADMGCQRTTQVSADSSQEDQAQQIKGVLRLEPFVVNLADADGNRYLRVEINLGLETPLPAKGRGGEIPVARIRDCILAVLSSWQSDALLAPEGKQKLKGELLQALENQVPELRVHEIYFTDFLVQR